MNMLVMSVVGVGNGEMRERDDERKEKKRREKREKRGAFLKEIATEQSSRKGRGGKQGVCVFVY